MRNLTILLMAAVTMRAAPAAGSGGGPSVTGIPDHWLATSSREVAITVSAGDTELRNLTLANTALIENTTKKLLPHNSLLLCSAAQSPCETAILLPAHSATVLYLRHLGSDAGVYSGKLRLLANNNLLTSEYPVTIYSTSQGRKAFGMATVILGVFLAWWIKTYISNRLTRDQALLPAAMQRERLEGFRADLLRAGGDLPGAVGRLSQGIEDWLDKLNSGWLERENLIPSRSPSPFNTGPIRTLEYATLLTQLNSAVEVFTEFMSQGVEVVLNEWVSAPPARKPDFLKTIFAIDRLYGPGVTAQQIRPKIQQLIDSLTGRGVVAAALDPTVLKPAGTKLNLDDLIVEIHRMNFAAWIVLLAITALGGILVLVVNKPGFGVPGDYLLCFLSSFGVPTVAGSLIPSTGLGVSMPRSTQGFTGS